MSKLGRKLGRTESAFVLTGQIAPFVTVGVLRLRHAPNPEKVEVGLGILQKRQPLLQVKIVQKDGGAYFETDPTMPAISFTLLPRQNENQWVGIATKALNTPLPLSKAPLMRCTYLFSEDRSPSELIFVFDHTIMDASSGFDFYHQLLRWCAREEDEGKMPAFTQILPPSEDSFPAKMSGFRRVRQMLSYMIRQMGDELRFNMRSRSFPKTPIHPTASCQIITAQLDAGITKALARQARQHHVTLSTTLLTTMLMVVQKYQYANQKRPLRAMGFTNLRPYLQPPIPAGYLGCYLAPMRYTLYSKSTDFWERAIELQQIISQAGERDEKYSSALFIDKLMAGMVRWQPSRLAHTALSYAGAVPLQKRYGEIELVDVHGFISNNRLGAELTAFATLLFGQLSWNFLYLDTDMDESTAQKIVAAVLELLTIHAKGETK